MQRFVLIRAGIGFALACYLALHGLKRNSLSKSGAVAAFIVGFLSFLASYRFGCILILFYYSSSKLTKVDEKKKSNMEENFKKGGQRTATQVLANSALATILSMAYFFGIGEDSHVWFNAALFESADEYKYQQHMAGVIWCMYIAHYACAAGDTWASEVGILASSRPRLVTTLFMRAVPPGTNGGMSILGTTTSALGGLFIGFSFYVMSLLMGESAPASQFPMVPLGLVCGLLGSIIDSLLGGTMQVTYYSHKKRKVVITLDTQDPSIEHVCGCDLLSNESVNAVSIAVTMLCAALAGPFVFCLCDSNTQC